MANGKTRVEIQDDSDADIRQADREMESAGREEQYYRSWPGRIAEGRGWTFQPGPQADEYHQRMTEAARRGMELRRGRARTRELAERLRDVLKDEPSPRRSAKKRAGKRD